MTKVLEEKEELFWKNARLAEHTRTFVRVRRVPTPSVTITRIRCCVLGWVVVRQSGGSWQVILLFVFKARCYRFFRAFLEEKFFPTDHRFGEKDSSGRFYPKK